MRNYDLGSISLTKMVLYVANVCVCKKRREGGSHERVFY